MVKHTMQTSRYKAINPGARGKAIRNPTAFRKPACVCAKLRKIPMYANCAGYCGLCKTEWGTDGTTTTTAEVATPKATTTRKELAEGCWSSYKKLSQEVLPTLESMLALAPLHRETIKMFGKVVKIPRRNRLFGDQDYSYSGITMKATPIPDVLKPLMTMLNEGRPTHKKYNVILANWYDNGKDYVSAHQDDEKGIVQSVPIVTVSLGATRKFRIRDKATRKILLDQDLENGSAFVMGGKQFQKKLTHEIVKTAKPLGMRISLTFRRMRA